MSRNPNRKDGSKTQHSMAAKLDNLKRFEDFEETVLPQIQKMMKDGKSSKEILEFGAQLAAARTVKEVLNPDAGRALTAAKDILDRADGKAKETKEHTHKFSELREEELDALINSRLSEISDDDEDDT